MGLREGSWGKGIFEKTLLGQKRKERFCKTRKVYIETFNIYHIFKVPRKLISLTFRKTKMTNCSFFPVPAMEALPLLVIYLFNSGELDHLLKICLMLSHLTIILTKSVKRLPKNSYVI